jgi:hypothetical protein
MNWCTGCGGTGMKMESIFLIHNWTCLMVMKTLVGGDLFEDGDDDDDDENELVEMDVEVRQLGFVVTP